jgi:hypothetical protein
VLDLDAGSCPDNRSHATIPFPARGVAVLGKAALQVFRLADVNQLVFLVVDEVDAGRVGKGLQCLKGLGLWAYCSPTPPPGF